MIVSRRRCGLALFSFVVFCATYSQAQTIPTFQFSAQGSTYTVAGSDPHAEKAVSIPVVVVPIALSFEAAGNKTLDSTPDIQPLLHSPVFTAANLGETEPLQYADALLRATFQHSSTWHMQLAEPTVSKTVRINIPVERGYLLHSARSKSFVGIADLEYVQKEVFRQVPKQEGSLVLLISHNTAYFAEGDATICCLWGTHGTDQTTNNSFVLASYLKSAPSIIEDQDVQPVTEQLAEFINDPLHDPLVRQEERAMPGNHFPRWIRPATMRPGDEGRCGGDGVASAYFLLEPTDTNHKNNFPYSKPYALKSGSNSYHVQNIALLPWYAQAADVLSNQYSFPDKTTLPNPAEACPARGRFNEDEAKSDAEAKPVVIQNNASKHALIGYWTGSGRNGATLPLRDVASQWDVIIVAFAVPDHSASEGTLRFEIPQGINPEDLKKDIAEMRSRGKRVLISLGGGGQFFSMDTHGSIQTFVSSVTSIVKDYGFDGVDIDFETPSLVIAPGDKDFQRPTTPSIVNLIAGLRQLHQDIGPSFMISLVPEGPQIPAGHVTYGGQFGSYLPLLYGLRDILSFVDVQDYNTPPLQGLDGEIYQAGTVDYHAAMTDLVLNGFGISGNKSNQFPAVPQDKVAVGYLVGETTPDIVADSMRYLITGQKSQATTYKLQHPEGYSHMIGAMFWTIDDDAKTGYPFSNLVGPELHAFGPQK